MGSEPISYVKKNDKKWVPPRVVSYLPAASQSMAFVCGSGLACTLM